MSIEKARETLDIARRELFHAKGNDQKIRQATEKAWRAAREAVYAVIDAVGEKPSSTTLHPSHVGEFERIYLNRGRGKGQPLEQGYATAMQVLHGKCFYDGDCPDEDLIESEMDAVEDLIKRAESDRDYLVVSRKRGRRR
jgi:hypothetical protein